jgi:ATP-dependent exoDNAse (exonuclease V) beta subunit
VLCRTNNEAEEVESLFLSRRIPYRTAGKSLLMNDYAVLDIVNLMMLCTSPGEPVYLAGFLRSPMANFGYGNLRNLAEKGPENLGNRQNSYTLEKLYSADRSLADTLGALVETSRFMLPTETLWHVYERFDPLSCYPGNTEGLLDLIEAAQTFEEEAEVRTLERFVRWLEENSDTIPIKSGAGRGITVQTIHAAKGLEYQTIILPYLSRQFKLKRNGSLVYTRSKDGSIDRYGIARPQYVEWLSEMRGMGAVMDENNREYRIDELNILYVAVTRAKENLVILPLAGRGETVGDVLIRALDQGIGNAGRFRMSKGRIAPSERGMLRIEHVYEKYSPKGVEMPQASREREPVPAPVGIRRRRSGMLKGLLFHKALEMSEHIPPPSEIDGLIRRAMVQVGSEYTEEERRIALESAKRAFVAAIADSRIRRYFTPKAMTEVETISSQYTNLIGRVDRVATGETVSVIDFKTDEPGAENNLEKLVKLYAPQVEGYCRSFSNLFPGRPIEGWLYFTEAPFRDRLVKVYDTRES